jgi:hypothetical protein
LGRRQAGIGIAGGLTEGRFKLRDIGIAGARFGKFWIKAEHCRQQKTN